MSLVSFSYQSGPPYKYAVICASNQNRSMEAHSTMLKKSMNVHSFGTNSQVKLPGPTASAPNIYPFGTPYDIIEQDLKNKDPQLYQQNGLLGLLERNKKIKQAPQRFQDHPEEVFDVIITCEERCFGIVCEEMIQRSTDKTHQSLCKPVHIINFDIQDNLDDAAQGAKHILNLTQQIEASKNLHDDMERILNDVQDRCNLKMLYAVYYY